MYANTAVFSSVFPICSGIWSGSQCCMYQVDDIDIDMAANNTLWDVIAPLYRHICLRIMSDIAD
jgi:hypothetical protein